MENILLQIKIYYDLILPHIGAVNLVVLLWLFIPT